MTDPTQDDALLARLRDWLRTARDEAQAGAADQDGDLSSVEGREPDVGLFRLVEEFTALRHEMKLQTKGARALQDQAEALLPAMRQAIDQFRAVAPKEAQAAFTAGRPLAEALADLDEALERGRIEIEKVRDRFTWEPTRDLATALDTLHARRNWLARLCTRGYHEEVRALIERREGWLHPERFEALLEGFSLIQNRLHRAMAAQEVRRIDSVGRPVDPERMTVVEIVEAADQPPGIVLEEYRRGYTWRDRVLREAEVRANRAAAIRPTAQEPSPDRPTDRLTD